MEWTTTVVVEDALPPACPKCEARAARWVAVRLRNRLALRQAAFFASGLTMDTWAFIDLCRAAGWRPEDER